MVDTLRVGFRFDGRLVDGFDGVDFVYLEFGFVSYEFGPIYFGFIIQK